MFVLRQIQANLARGEASEIARATVFPFRMRDIAPKYALQIGDDELEHGNARITFGTTYTMVLPNGYANTARLFVALKTNAILKATVTSPDHGTSNFLIQASTGPIFGEHPGLLIWDGSVTSIVITNPVTGSVALLEWAMHEIPDLTLAASFQGGQLALGVAAE